MQIYLFTVCHVKNWEMQQALLGNKMW